MMVSMGIERANSAGIGEGARQLALNHYDLNIRSALGKGTEAEVYALSEDLVLKLYEENLRFLKRSMLDSMTQPCQLECLEYIRLNLLRTSYA